MNETILKRNTYRIIPISPESPAERNYKIEYRQVDGYTMTIGAIGFPTLFDAREWMKEYFPTAREAK